MYNRVASSPASGATRPLPGICCHTPESIALESCPRGSADIFFSRRQDDQFLGILPRDRLDALWGRITTMTIATIPMDCRIPSRPLQAAEKPPLPICEPGWESNPASCSPYRRQADKPNPTEISK
jgi:hypothetical protein